MTKQYLQTMLMVMTVLLSTTTVAKAAPATGEYVVKLWNDSTGVYADTWNICIQSGGNWYISSNIYTGIHGKWFSKGNDTHLQAIHSSGTAAVSFDVSRVNNGILTGYYKTLDSAGTAGYYTAFISYKGAACVPYIP